jgi:hypothetical protein
MRNNLFYFRKKPEIVEDLWRKAGRRPFYAKHHTGLIVRVLGPSMLKYGTFEVQILHSPRHTVKEPLVTDVAAITRFERIRRSELPEQAAVCGWF